ncbi:hypothetical protein GCM10008015_18080 [Flavobacterium palustre]|uniref:Outer membrane protein beta-barrel domain-containing protein n=1 Tax=Flavobacterium palustre TaxID=1476463 RepID=A0ABQ1HHH6_9FLAO|nr:hypothetical protein [Flavobacterium palustre]GGA77814.1 hypothetical protein GCM10008015_18080 [Flavobacterium palustre]
MSISFRSVIIIILVSTFYSNSLKAQPKKGEYINASIGLGLSTSYYEEDGGGTGFYAQAEYANGITKWIGLRTYAGVILTNGDKTNENGDPTEYRISSKAFSLGGKIRVAAPIPYVAPFIESGIGASIGSFHTYTPSTNLKKNGVLMHIPFSLGLAVGRKHSVDIALSYYFYPSMKQISGAFAAGVSIPINN